MSHRHAFVVAGPAFIGLLYLSLLVGCGDSQPKTEPKKSEPKQIAQPDAGKENAGKENANKSEATAAKTKSPTPKPKPPEPPWLITLPSKATLNAFLRPEGENRFFLGRAGRFSGSYELRAKRLVITKPVDPLETGFEWEEQGPDTYVLVAQRPNVGNDYLGATMKRVNDGETKKPSP